jgi:hypothetical protein
MGRAVVDCSPQRFIRSDSCQRRRFRHASEKLLTRRSFAEPNARPVSAVPWLARAILALALVAQISWQACEPKPIAHASDLIKPADVSWFRVLSDGEPIALAQILLLYLQAFDNQPGISVPFRDLNYGAVEAWLNTALDLDPATQYPFMMAAQLYAQVPDARKQRQMLEFVHREYLRDPERRWRWLAHAAIIAKHRLKDMPLALRYAEDITRYAKGALGWARQMRIFILEDIGEVEAAAVLLGGLLASGELTDDAEIHFLTERLKALETAAKSSKASEIR